MLSLLHFLTYIVLFTVSSVLASAERNAQCNSTVLRRQTLDILESRNKGATIESLNVTSVKSIQECVTTCCDETGGNCTIGIYRKSNKSNCLLITCQPLSACSFLSSNDTDLVVAKRNKQIPPLLKKNSNAKHPYHLGNVNYNNSSNISNTSSNITRKSFSKETATVSPSDEISTTNGKDSFAVPKRTYEIDANKTVQTAEESNITDVPVKTKLPPSDLNLPSAITEKPQASESTVKGFPNESTPDVDKNKTVPLKKGVLDNDNRELKNIFQADNDTTEIIPESSDTSSTGEIVTSTGNIKHDEQTAPPKSQGVTTTVALNSSVFIFPKTSLNISSTQSVEDPNLPFSSFESTTPSTINQVSFSLNPSSSEISYSSSSELSQLPKETSSASSVVDQNTSTNSASFDVQSSSSSEYEIRTEASIPVNATNPDSDKDATVKFHLVFALVLGLMLLLTVVGLILRRVYDVWQRRHYQRMDFLVDGLYNNVNT